MNCWTRVSTNHPVEINGNIYSVREIVLAVVATPPTATPPCLQEMETCFMDALIEWESTWLWYSLRIFGEENWLEGAILDGTCLAVTNGSYMKELYPDLCSVAFVLEFSNGRGGILG